MRPRRLRAWLPPVPDSKTGAKVVPLGSAALNLLAGLPRFEGSPYVPSWPSREGAPRGPPSPLGTIQEEGRARRRPLARSPTQLRLGRRWGWTLSAGHREVPRS